MTIACTTGGTSRRDEGEVTVARLEASRGAFDESHRRRASVTAEGSATTSRRRCLRPLPSGT